MGWPSGYFGASYWGASYWLGGSSSTLTLGLPTQYDNIALPAALTKVDAVWTRVSVEFSGCELLDFGAQNGYRISGRIRIDVYAPLEAGDGVVIDAATQIEDGLQNLYIAPPVPGASSTLFGEASHGLAARDGASWVVTVYAPFRTDFDEAPSSLIDTTSLATLDANAMHRAIRVAFAAAIAGESLPVIYDNAAIPTGVSRWARFTVLTGDGFAAENGVVNRRRTPGVAKAVVHVPAGIGVDEAMRLADVISRAFRSTSCGGVDFQVPAIRQVGRVESWWAVAIDCPFTADMTR
jgi:hypothetical protein